MERSYHECHLCPRQCGVDRTSGATGFCGESARLRIASIGPHYGEEPCFSGTCGSGTIFFTGCSAGCFFCQNYQISHEHMGRYYTQEAFLAAAKALVDRGVHNLNFVTPDHFWPHIEVLCHALRRRGESIPFLFNSSGYHLPEMVEMYAEWMDIFMPDFKFADAALARQCIGDGRYPERALSALEKMVSYSGFLRPWDPSGQVPAQQGVLVRHLVLPGFVDNSLKVLTLLYEHFGPDLPLSVMSQFHPVPACTSRGMLTGKLPIEAYRRVYNHAVDLGFTHAFMQDIPQSSCFLPDFSRDEPFQGNRYESHE